MSLQELFILAVGLAMDAFAVSVCKGLSVRKAGVKECCIAGLYFGGFQALMPAIGYFLGVQFKEYITNIDHWIAFILLGIIGFNMIRESREKGCDEDGVCSLEEHPFAAAIRLAVRCKVFRKLAPARFALYHFLCLSGVTQAYRLWGSPRGEYIYIKTSGVPEARAR